MSSYNNAILVVALTDLSTPHSVAHTISAAAKSTDRRLLILVLSPLFNHDRGISHTECWDDVQRFLSFAYVQAALAAHDIGNEYMDADVLLKGMDEDLPEYLGSGMEVCFRVDGDGAIANTLPHSISSLPQVFLPCDPPPPNTQTRPSPSPSPPSVKDTTPPPPPLFPNVIIGGTFDNLHPGHKLLLSMAAWIASEKIVVGVTDDALLKSKSYKEMIEPFATRVEKVRAFLALFRPGLVYDIVPIHDVYGPTGWDPNIQALVVSKETLDGAKSIAAHRKAEALPPLQTFVIDVISTTSSNLNAEDVELLKRTKMSSTAIRERKFQNLNNGSASTT